MGAVVAPDAGETKGKVVFPRTPQYCTVENTAIVTWPGSQKLAFLGLLPESRSL